MVSLKLTFHCFIDLFYSRLQFMLLFYWRKSWSRCNIGKFGLCPEALDCFHAYCLFVLCWYYLSVLFAFIFSEGHDSGSHRQCSVGQYMVEVEDFERIALPALLLVSLISFSFRVLKQKCNLLIKMLSFFLQLVILA